jgi:predicted sugar kinase
VEVYDLDRPSGHLANISSRGLVQTGDEVMIGGFIVDGGRPQNTIVRAIGPSLPVSGALADPKLEIYNSEGVLVASNNDWRGTQEAEVIATGIPPTHNRESAIAREIPAGAYTALVRGFDGAPGVALVEVYALD